MIEFIDAPQNSERLIENVYAHALRHFKQDDIFMIEVSFISADEMKDINRETRGVDAVTDVLSFPNLEIKRRLPVKKSNFPDDIDFETDKLILGEIVMCMEKIKEQASEFGHSVDREAGYLFLHGLLHLFGFDHIDDSDKTQMRAEEESILTSAGLTRVN